MIRLSSFVGALLLTQSIIVAQANWHGGFDQNTDWISLMNKYFGDSETYVGTRSINSKPHVLFLLNQSVKKKGAIMEASLVQIDFSGDSNDLEGVGMIVNCDCSQYRMKVVHIAELHTGVGGNVDYSWEQGIGDSMASRILAAVCDPYTQKEESIRLVKENGVYKIPVRLNGALAEYFIFDTGAASLYISNEVALMMKKIGVLNDDSDLIGTTKFVDANGRIETCKVYLLKSVEVGNRIVYNVECAVSNTPIDDYLLGQSFMEKLGKFEFDYSSNRLILK